MIASETMFDAMQTSVALSPSVAVYFASGFSIVSCEIGRVVVVAVVAAYVGSAVGALVVGALVVGALVVGALVVSGAVVE